MPTYFVVFEKVVSNICLKLNSKLGGTNHVLAPTSRPEAFKVPFMVMGADVSHAPPESKVRRLNSLKDLNFLKQLIKMDDQCFSARLRVLLLYSEI